MDALNGGDQTGRGYAAVARSRVPVGSAFAEFREKEKGSITPGKLADVVILDADLFSIAPEKIKDVAVRYTLVGGKLIYEAGQN